VAETAVIEATCQQRPHILTQACNQQGRVCAQFVHWLILPPGIYFQHIANLVLARCVLLWPGCRSLKNSSNLGSDPTLLDSPVGVFTFMVMLVLMTVSLAMLMFMFMLNDYENGHGDKCERGYGR
jgi:hypothetical protein